jgi:hypothetical protein
MQSLGLVALCALCFHASALSLAPQASPQVDLGYAIYQGSHDSNSSINVFKGYVELSFPAISKH